MKVLMTLSQLEVTGAEVYAGSLADRLIARGNTVFIISDTLTKRTKAEYHSLPLTKRTIFFRLRNILSISRFIIVNQIDIVHAHSRAAAWVCKFACMFCRVPLIVTVHGRQSHFLSRKIIRAFGFYTITVCEKLKEQLINSFNYSPNKIEVLRNGFDIETLTAGYVTHQQQIVSIITRLSGPKGELAMKFLEYLSGHLTEFPGVKFRVIGGQNMPECFKKFENIFEFSGFHDSLKEKIVESTVVIGSGRIAIESILLGKSTLAMGEALTIGLIDENNIDYALTTNFGDMDEKEKQFDFEKMINDLKRVLKAEYKNNCLRKRLVNEFDIEKITDRIESIYQSVLVRYHKYEIPIIYYHRVIRDLKETGRKGIYVTEKQFEEHLSYLKKKGFTSVSFEDALELKKANKKGKYVIITFDDGYQDNYLLAFPLLKKYGFKALVFMVAESNHNDWDSKSGEIKLPLMNFNQIKEMSENGIDFGSHTLSHCNLSKTDYDSAKKELTESKRILEEKIGRSITTVAYPYGEFTPETINIVKEAGYKFAFATDQAPLGLHENYFAVRRIGIFPNTFKHGFSRKVSGKYPFIRIKRDSRF